MYHTEGVRRGLYRGGVFTTARAAILTSAVIGSYDSIKNNILKKYCGMQDGPVLFVTCSLLAGVITTTAANPGAYNIYLACEWSDMMYCGVNEVVYTYIYLSITVNLVSLSLYCMLCLGTVTHECIAYLLTWL